MSFFDKAKQAAGQAAAKVREGAEDAQQKLELNKAYNELGKTAFELLDSGQISHADLDATAARIRELKEKLADSPDGGETSTVAADPDQPPAMPT